VIDPVENLPPLRDVIAAAGLAAKKSLGQNFLFDLNLTGRIARHAGPFHDNTVIEVGPGPGGLTRALLLGGAQHVVAIERDDRAVAALQPLVEAAEGRLRIIPDDALKFDFSSLPAPRQIVANLPYNIATLLLLGWLEDPSRFTKFTLMFQKEVALRLVATPGSSEYSRLSVMAQWRCKTKKLFDISPAAFTPPPKVTSSVVELIPYPVDPAGPTWVQMERVVAVAFSQRRKMLRSNLKALGDAEALCAAIGVPGTVRAEELTIEHFVKLAGIAHV